MRHVHYDECLVFRTRDTCFTFSLVVGVGPATNDSRHMPVGYCGCPALGSSRPCTDVRERLNHLDVSKPSSISWPVPTDPRGAARGQAWPRRESVVSVRAKWCCRWVSNLRPLPYQGSALPLSYGSIPDRRRVHGATGRAIHELPMAVQVGHTMAVSRNDLENCEINMI